jgi:CubicO group peptidase (beta-lactamase class C family)
MKTLMLSILLIIQNAFAEQVKWPVPDWEKSIDLSKLNTKTCNEFKKFSTENKKFLTEGLVVIKDGQIQFEYYDEKNNQNTSHALWSVSKTITGALLGIAVDEGKLNLDDELYRYIPDPKNRESYKEIKIKNLFYFDAGFIWDEYYSGDVKNSKVINSLYGRAHNDVVKFAASSELISEGPGYKFNYSTGTPVLTMGVLNIIYGSEYSNLPWSKLFNPLGIKSAFFERDNKGVFLGGSSAFATPRDMARIGYMYLHNGEWNGHTILSEDWISKTKTVSPGYLSEGTVIKDITMDGVYGGSIWLNVAAKRGLGRPYPHSPEDMLFARGHYGQMIIVLPSQNMVITRTGRDKEYDSKVDAFVSKAIACFHDPDYPIGEVRKPSEDTTHSIGDLVTTLKSSLRENIFQPAVAKTLCSCHFIGKLDFKTCYERSNIPLSQALTNIMADNNTVIAYPSFLAKHSGFKNKSIAIASFDTANPKLGCLLK